MEFLGEVATWFANEPWLGRDSISERTLEHLTVAFAASAVAVLIALPPALTLAHMRRGNFIANAVVNIGRAVPSYGVVVLSVPIALQLGVGAGAWPLFVALVLLAIPPMFTNAYAGISGVEPAMVEAARGMGMRPRDVLLRVELPTAAPVVLAGVRVATVQVVATATLGAAAAAFDGLGRYVLSGFRTRDYPQVFAGALLVVVLTFLTEGLFTLGERRLLPPGVRRTVRRADVVEATSTAAA